MKAGGAAFRYSSALMAARTRILMALTLGVALFAGCKRPQAPDETDPIETTTTVDPEAGPTHLPRFAEIQSFPTVSKLRTSHPLGDRAATVRADATATGYGKPGRNAMPVGAMVVEELATEPDGPPLLYYVMEKQAAGFYAEGGDWSYSVVSSDGMFRATGKLTLCARCHAEAPHDFLFEHVAGMK